MWQCTQSVLRPPISEPSEGMWQSAQPIALFAWEPILIGNFASGCWSMVGTQAVVAWQSAQVVGNTPT